MRFALAALFTLAATAAAAQTPVLRPTILVAGDLVRIGDLVDHAAPAKAQIAIFRAPDLGETGIVAVAAVIEALRPHHVYGVDSGGVSEISVTRASRVIGGGEIKARIADLVADRLRISNPANLVVTFDAPLPAIHLDAGNSAPLMPVRATIEPRGGRFDVVFKTDGAAAIRVTGMAQEAFETVVLTRAMARGETVRESDLAVEKRPKSEIQAETIRDPAAVIGMAMQQPLRAGQTIRSTDVAKPHLARRGEPVVLHYEVPGIVLTARGKAEESGALGDVVNVLNIQSKRVVQGVVAGPGQIKVISLAPRVAAAASTTDLASVQPPPTPTAGRSRAE